MDWLHDLIFNEIRRVWKEAVSDGNSPLGLPPDSLRITQFSGVSVQPFSESKTSVPYSAVFDLPTIKEWRFDGVNFNLEPKVGNRSETVIRGSFFQVGSVQFGISSDRKLVAIHHLFGPRYGQHRVFSVRGQGRKGHLQPHPDFVWLQF